MNIKLELGNFTPVLDELVNEFGFLTAGVYGMILRCEQEDGTCQKPLGRLADEMGINWETLRIHLQKLIDAEYIEDLTPELRNRPHIYRTTGKLKLVWDDVSIPETQFPRFIVP